MENKMNGKDSNALASGTSASFSAEEVATLRPMKITNPWRALSLKAPSNCVTIKLQKPRKRGSIGSSDSGPVKGLAISNREPICDGSTIAVDRPELPIDKSLGASKQSNHAEVGPRCSVSAASKAAPRLECGYKPHCPGGSWRPHL